jgi:hypothetical protein
MSIQSFPMKITIEPPSNLPNGVYAIGGPAVGSIEPMSVFVGESTTVPELRAFITNFLLQRFLETSFVTRRAGGNSSQSRLPGAITGENTATLQTPAGTTTAEIYVRQIMLMGGALNDNSNIVAGDKYELKVECIYKSRANQAKCIIL